MEDISGEKHPVQPVINGRQIILCGPQDSVGHGLAAQGDALAIQLLLLTINGSTHYESLSHDVGDSLWRGEAAGNNTFFMGEP